MRLAGALPACGGLLLVAGVCVVPHFDPRFGVIAAVAMGLAGFVMARRSVLGRVAATAVLAVWTIKTLPPLSSLPATALGVWLLVLWLVSALWIVPGLPDARRRWALHEEIDAQLAGIRVALRCVALLAVAVALAIDTAIGASRIGLAVALLALAGWMLLAGLRHAMPLRWLLIVVAAMGLGAVVIFDRRIAGGIANVLLLLVVLVASAILRQRESLGGLTSRWWEHLLDHPARQLVTSFLCLILLGALLLKLPLASAAYHSVSFVDAVFTAVSAVCVTGLIVLDTPAAWSGWGQAVILVLIQFGGLGIMSFATAFLGALGQRLPVRQEGAFAQVASGENRRDLYRAVKTVLGVTLVAEMLGAVILLPRFVDAGDDLGSAMWRATFTAVSAFCNAGFALQSNSLIGFARDPWVLHTVGTLIVLGGLSPAVVVGLFRNRRRLTVQSRLVLWTSAWLLGVGAMLFIAAEWNNVLAGFGFWDKVHNGWFQSVTLRTAGFNSVDIASLRPATITLCILWMFIGGSPGGTAGGIKTTTFAVLMLAVAGAVQGRWSVTAFNRSISHATVYRAASVATIGSIALILFVLAIQLTQVAEVIPGIFEVVSALGTVGLSMGITAGLDTVGKIIIMTAMFAGRVGSMTLIVFLVAQRIPPARRVPEEHVVVG